MQRGARLAEGVPPDVWAMFLVSRVVLNLERIFFECGHYVLPHVKKR
jgi:hypothetical protein